MPLTIIKKRALIIFVVFATLFVLLIGRLAYWQIYRGGDMRERALNQQTSKTTVTASRGNIYDRNGKILAESANVSTLVCNPRDVADKGDADIAADILSELLDLDREEVYTKLTKSGTSYQTIKKRLTVDETEAITELKAQTEGKSESELEKAKALTGVYFEEDSKRYYLYNVAPHVIGFTGYDNNGLQGIELTFDDELSGTAGNISAARTASGTTLTDKEYESIAQAADGSDVTLTIDETIQHILEKYLEDAVTQNELKEGAAGIIMNPNTGEILAMATKPDFDLNDPYSTETFEDLCVDFTYESELVEEEEQKKANEKSQRAAALSEALEEALESIGGEDFDKEAFIKEFEANYDSMVDNSELSELEEQIQQERTAAMRNKMWRNKAISDSYEPGSTFKIITAAAALEENAVTLDTPMYCAGYKKFGSTEIHCHVTSGHGAQTFEEAVKHSCNVAFMDTGLALGEEKFMEYFRAFGLTEKTDIELIGEAGSIYYKDKMGVTDLATSAFGQGFQVTPLQLITAVSAVINGGNLMKPQIVKEISNESGIVKSYQPEVINKVISEETSETMRYLLEQVVSATDGTGRNAYVKGYRIGGKTGTSEKQPRGTDKRIASFIGFAPADDPQIVCLIMLDEPQVAVKYGGTIAAPVAGSIIAETLDYLGVEKQYSEDEEPDETVEVPDVRDVSVDQAKYLLNEAGLKANISGSGSTVYDQLPKPGVTIDAGSTIVCYTDSVSNEDDYVTVPNVIGMSVSEARSTLSARGLNFEISGAGLSDTSGEYAVSQSPEAGEKVAPSTVVGVEFRHKATD